MEIQEGGHLFHSRRAWVGLLAYVVLAALLLLPFLL